MPTALTRTAPSLSDHVDVARTVAHHLIERGLEAPSGQRLLAARLVGAADRLIACLDDPYDLAEIPSAIDGLWGALHLAVVHDLIDETHHRAACTALSRLGSSGPHLAAAAEPDRWRAQGGRVLLFPLGAMAATRTLDEVLEQAG